MELPKRGFFSTVFSALLRPFVRYFDRRSLPHYRGDLSLVGLNKSVEVLWDRYAIPHVFASDERDLFFAQGYLHAQERLWQMEMSRRFLCGRMAEIFGDFALPWRDISNQFRGRTCADFDYFVRLLGIRSAAAESLDILPEADRLRLYSYCDGVNRYIEQCGKKLPWEFRLLRHEPEPWRPQDTLTIGKGFAFLLSTALYTRLNFIAVAAKLADEPDKLRTLLPTYPDDAPVTARAVWDGARGAWQFTTDILAACDWHPAGNGSNSWAIAPNRSTTGGAILCNDPHLRMTLPSVWYLMHLKATSDAAQPDGYEVCGASIPGAPCVQLGHNRYISWGITAAVCDDVEIYREKLHPLEPDLYRVGHRWEKLQTSREQIAIRRQAPFEKIIRKSRHGPAISDFSDPRAGGEILTVRWTAHEPSQELRSVYGVNCARNWQEFQESLRHHSAPSLNYVYADRDGNIGYTLAGRIPRRTNVPSLLPVPGWEEGDDWLGYIPFEELPRVYNPPQGAVASANNRVTDAAYPYYLSHFVEPPHRIRRIQELLEQPKKLSAEDLAAIQLDSVSLHARELIATLEGELARIPEDSRTVKIAANRLLSWDGSCAITSIEAAIFHVFHHRLLVNLLVPALGEDLCSAYIEILNQCVVPIDRILSDLNSTWFGSRSRLELVTVSLGEACAELEDNFGANIEAWRWGKIHQLHMNHALGRSKILKPFLSIGPMPTPGDGMTVNSGFYRHSNPYTQTVGASLRFIVELNSSIRSGFVLPSGQSGHPSSTHYSDQTELWLKGKRIPFRTVHDHLRLYDSRLLLNPAQSGIAPKHASG
ncbi:MAG TPA: penicillin acylase family protein [Candidatus Binatia bacterium]